MTHQEFEGLWNGHFAALNPLVGEPIPNFDDFIIRERMVEDYLDIFRGYNSRNGDIIMPYPHPFFDSNGNPLLANRPCIKYILIGEAPPPLRALDINECGGDQANTYFYDKRHVGRIIRTSNGRVMSIPTPWLNAPRLNWGCPPFQPCPDNKVQTLLCLASKGVLLLDLFPFALAYTSVLRYLLITGATRSFWDDPTNPYNLQDRIQAIQHLLCNDWDLSLVAPCIISGHIIYPINLFPPIMATPAGIHPFQFRTIMYNNARCPLGGDFRKVAVSAAGAPTPQLINISF